MKLTRRKLAAALLAPAAVTAAPQAPALDDTLLKTARERSQANFAAVAKVDLPMATEPSFQFKV